MGRPLIRGSTVFPNYHEYSTLLSTKLTDMVERIRDCQSEISNEPASPQPQTECSDDAEYGEDHGTGGLSLPFFDDVQVDVFSHAYNG